MWIHWNSNPSDITEHTFKLINKSTEINNKISNYKFKSKTTTECKEFLKIISDDVTEMDNFHSMCNFILMISPDKKLKDVCLKSIESITSYQNDLDYRKDIYKNIKLFDSIHKKNMTKDDKKFIDKITMSYKKNGINLSHNKLKTFKEIKQNISCFENDIQKSITSFDKCIKITEFDIKGVPENIIKNLPIVDKNPIKYGIVMNNEMYEICMNYINNHVIRQRIEHFFNTKCLDNTGKLAELFYYRDRFANILQYDNYTDTCVESHVAKNHGTIKKFMADMLLKTDVRYIKELKMLLKLKEKHFKLDGIEFDGKLNSWDICYYTTKWKQNYGLDDDNVSQYFPRKPTIFKIIKIFESMFNLKIEKMKNPMAWHKDVDLYQVKEDIGNKYNLVGYFYLDLYKRKNKYNQTRCFNLQYPCSFPLDSSYQYPMVVFVSNILKVSDCFTHKEISTIFHEFGHIIHQLLGKAKYSIFSGTNVEYDFVEVFGLVYEKLSWETSILNKISTHKTTGEPLPLDTITKMCNIRNLCIGISTRKQILCSYYDQLMHCSDNFIKICSSLFNIENTEERCEKIYKTMFDIYSQLYGQIMSAKDLDGTLYKIHLNSDIFPPASWLHLTGPSSSMYYSELWSEIYATDLFCNKLQHNSENNEINRDILNRIMLYNSKKSPLSRITKYLERTPNSDNYLMYFDFIPNDVEYSFFFNTEIGLKSSDDEKLENNQFNNSKFENVFVSNKIDRFQIDTCDDTDTDNKCIDDNFDNYETDDLGNQDTLEEFTNRFSEFIESDLSKMNNTYRDSNTTDINQSEGIGTDTANPFIKHR